MKTERNILIAFILNISFSIFEFIGGIFTGSVAILSDAVHDLGDALSIGISYGLEKKSKRKPDDIYTYGYVRYSVIGGVITTIILIVGSIIVGYNAILRLFDPVTINYNGMIVMAIIGVIVNSVAAIVTHEGSSINQRAVNLHMLEDVLGWVVVLIGAVVMRFTDFSVIDPILSLMVSAFILFNAFRNLRAVLDIFLEKSPHDTSSRDVKAKLLEVEGVEDVHHIHVWTMDGQNHYATMHVVTNETNEVIKHKVREALASIGIGHSTIEIERIDETCLCCDCEAIELDPHMHSHAHGHSHAHVH
ncbi:MAG: cation diffusion facilitator family transporter [Coriobacteriia bacterium]|nr:cation diffusion facilitator family transporter [Coriobacteriia bacterium]